MIRIEVLKGEGGRSPSAGSLYDYEELPITIGRASSNQLVLLGDRVARFHARIEHVSGRLVIVDRCSENGITVEGRHGWSSFEVSSPTRVEIGNFVLRIVLL